MLTIRKLDHIARHLVCVIKYRFRKNTSMTEMNNGSIFREQIIFTVFKYVTSIF